MNQQLVTFDKIKLAESENLVPAYVEDTLDKLINITRVAQFEQLNLSDEDCDEMITHLDSIETKLSANNDYISRVHKMKPEYIPITLSDENFI